MTHAASKKFTSTSNAEPPRGDHQNDSGFTIEEPSSGHDARRAGASHLPPNAGIGRVKRLGGSSPLLWPRGNEKPPTTIGSPLRSPQPVLRILEQALPSIPAEAQEELPRSFTCQGPRLADQRAAIQQLLDGEVLY